MATEKLVVAHGLRLATTAKSPISLTTRQSGLGTGRGSITTNNNGTYIYVEPFGTEWWVSNDDGVTWVELAVAPSSTPPLWDGARWITITTRVGGRDLKYSLDGIDWVDVATQSFISSVYSIFMIDGKYAALVNDGSTNMIMYATPANITGTWSTTNITGTYSIYASAVSNSDRTEALLICADSSAGSLHLLTDPASAPTAAVTPPAGYDASWRCGTWSSDHSAWFVFGFINDADAADQHFVWSKSTDGLNWDATTSEGFEGTPSSCYSDGTYIWVSIEGNASNQAKLMRFDGTSGSISNTNLSDVSGDRSFRALHGYPSDLDDLTGVNGVVVESDTSEPISGATITLELDSDVNGSYETSIGTFTTNSLGEFYFPGLAPGNYRTTISGLPSGFSVTTTQTFTVSSGATATRTYSVDAPSISGHVFYDVTADGNYAGTEDPMEDVEVSLINDGSTIETVTTDVNGFYSFTLLASDTYTVEASLFGSPYQSNYEFSTADSVEDTIGTGEDAVINFGVTTSYVTGTIFRDNDGDGADDAVPLPAHYPHDIKVYKYSAGSWNHHSDCTADSNGDFQTDNFPSGQYLLKPSLTGSSFVLTNSNDEESIDFSTQKVISFTVEPGEHPIIDVGVALGSTITFDFFIDTDQDGVLDGGEDNYGSVSSATLERSNPGANSFTTFATYGATLDYITVSDLPPGDYRLSYNGDGYWPGVDYVTQTVTEASSSNFTDPGNSYTVYTPLWVSYAVTGKVFLDADYDGVYEADSGISGITVALYDGVDLVDSTTTNGSGNFSLDAVNGSHNVVISPGSYVATSASSVPITVASAAVSNVNFGLIQPAQLTVRVWNDEDGDGVRDGSESMYTGADAGVSVWRSGVLVHTGTVDASGEMVVANLVPGSYTALVTIPPPLFEETSGVVAFSLTPSEIDSVYLGVRLDTGLPPSVTYYGWGFMPIA